MTEDEHSEDDEEMTLFTRRFNKRPRDRQESNEKIVYYQCKKSGYMKRDCPNLIMKGKKGDKP